MTGGKFAVYYLPSNPLYELGCQLVGWDVRSGRLSPAHPDLVEALGGNPVDWVGEARQYGFHVSLSEAVALHRSPSPRAEMPEQVDLSAFPEIERELGKLLSCFPRDSFRLSSPQVINWGGQTVVVCYKPSDELRMLAALIAARVHPIGRGTGYSEALERRPQKFEPWQRARIRLFHSHRIFEAYTPHFTIFNPYTGDDLDRVKQVITSWFEEYPQLDVDRLSILFQPDNGNFHLVSEFVWHDGGWQLVTCRDLERIS